MARPILLLLPGLLALTGCWSAGYNAEMMADGNTWQVSAMDYSLCGGTWHSADTCIKNLKPIIEKRAIETCNGTPFRIYNCGHRHAAGGAMGREVACSVQCRDAAQIRLKEPIYPSSELKPKPVTDDLMKKAKKCQVKGGVWVNDVCQINVDE